MSAIFRAGAATGLSYACLVGASNHERRPVTNDSTPVEPRAEGLPAIQELTRDECNALLARHRLCTMSVVDGSTPYAVPLFYGFDGATLHLGLAEGRKTALLDGNPQVCLSVVELGGGDAWASVLITGTAEFVAEPEERQASVRILMEHNRRVRELSGELARDPAGSPRRHGSGRIMRVANPQFSGRARR